MTRRERFWKDNILIRELLDGIEITENLGKTKDQIGLPLSAPKPTLLRKASNAAGAAGRAIKAKASGQAVTASNEERDRRMAICNRCQFFTGATCLKCGCIARWKTKLATEKCPVGKW